MNAHELILLSPYQVPAQNALALAEDDTAAFLNGYTALWHPLVLAGAARAPKIASAYDHEQPASGCVYAVPQTPPLLLPDDWEQRVAAAGSIAFRANADRNATLTNLQDSVVKSGLFGASEGLLELLPDQRAPFFAIGFGFLMVNALFQAMEHENLLAATDLWQDVQQAIAALGRGQADACRENLQAAANKLLNGREILYPSAIYIIDICLLEALTQPGAPLLGAGEGRLWGDLPAAFEKGLPVNVVAPVIALEKLSREDPERCARLRERFQSDTLEICTGCYLEREDALLPTESQMWNLLKGCRTFQELLGGEVRVYGRRRFAASPQLPLFLNNVGITKALLLPFDNGVLPNWRSAVVSWPSPDGKQVETFARLPHPADSAQTFFHLAHYLHKTIRQDQAATLGIVHQGKPAFPCYEDWLELTRLAPVLGQWFPLGRYFSEAMGSEYGSASSADDFHSDYLEERVNAQVDCPVAWFPRQQRLRRQLDTAWTLAGLYRGLVGGADSLRPEEQLARLEDQLESGAGAVQTERELILAQERIGQTLADRLVSRAPAQRPGYLVLNPCSFTRRVALEMGGLATPLPLEGPLKACQLDPDKARLVVEVPPLGFAWFPRAAPGTAPLPVRAKLADQRVVRNEFFEAEVDPVTGGLRALRDHRLRINRVGQQLVFNPGSKMRASALQVTSTGPALGEIVSSGTVQGEQDQVLARFKQRFRAWAGRPVLELRLELTAEQPPAGYPWHAYFAARFAWGDERVVMLRGVNSTAYITNQTRPETPDFIELRLGPHRTALFLGGLPFLQRQGTRMLDVLLMPAGETTQVFDLALGLERDHLMATAQAMVTPIPVVPTVKGPPHVGASGWLFHLDVPNLLLTSLRPVPGADSLTFRFQEVNNHSGPAELRCVRDPRQAVTVDARGNVQLEAAINGDAVSFESSSCDLVQLRVAFSE